MIADAAANDTTLGVALIVAVVGPVILNALNRRGARWDKLEDQRREDVREAARKEERDLVASQAAEAAKLLYAAQQETSEQTAEVARVAQLAVDAGDRQYQSLRNGQQEIHTLVNSDMTAARADELAKTRLLLVALRKIIELDRDAGREPSEEDLAEVTKNVDRVKELEFILADRHAQQVKADTARDLQAGEA